jgi:hypothetical protein
VHEITADLWRKIMTLCLCIPLQCTYGSEKVVVVVAMMMMMMK